MVTVEEAEKAIQSHIKDFGREEISFENASGRVLAKEIVADRDLPPFNRVSMDGIAINYNGFEAGIRSFFIKATQAAGDQPVEIGRPDECIEIMTGAALPNTTDTVIRYEDVNIETGKATLINGPVHKGQNVHKQGHDSKKHTVVGHENQFIGPPLICMAASVGSSTLVVKKLPGVVVISTGDELVEVNQAPSPYQIRRSNNYTIQAVLREYHIQADMLHLPDDPHITRLQLENCLKSYDVILLTGGISMGKFDYVPQVMEELSVKKIVHKVLQRPGKPFWFGVHSSDVLVFAFPGNPVSTFMCLHRYFIPWLTGSLGTIQKPAFAVLDDDFEFRPSLQYFMQVSLYLNANGRLLANPVEGNGSGDFSNLLATDAFMELPAEQQIFAKGQVFRIWPFKHIF